MAKQVPQIGAWYQDTTLDTLFEVVAIDEHTFSIEVQYEDGEVSEIDFETWKQMVFLPAAQPEDWRNSLGMSSDQADLDDIISPERWDDPLMSIEPDISFGFDEY